MKLIVAIIQPDKLDEVHQSLIAAEIFRITVSRVTGHGQQEDPELYRGEEVVPNLIPKVRLETTRPSSSRRSRPSSRVHDMAREPSAMARSSSCRSRRSSASGRANAAAKPSDADSHWPACRAHLSEARVG